MYLINEIHATQLDNDELLIINLINGAADFIHVDIYNKLLNSDYANIDAEILNKLLDRRYLFKSEHDFLVFQSKIDGLIQESELHTAPNFLIVPTYACNLNCIYCYEQTYEIDHKKSIDIQYVLDEQFKFIKNTFVALKASNKQLVSKDVLITLMGGEPLLAQNKEHIQLIMSKIRQDNYSFNIVTNGVDLHHYLDDLVSYEVKDIQVTLDGSKDIHDKRRLFRFGQGSFDVILTNIGKALDKKIKVNIRVNVDKGNIHNLPELATTLLSAFGHNDLLHPYIYLLQDGGCSGDTNVLSEKVGIEEILSLEEKFPQIKLFYKKFHPSAFINSIFSDEMFQPSLRHCGASSNQYILDYKGNIYKCWHGIGNSNYAVASLLDKSKTNSNLINQWENRNTKAIEKCSTCKYRYICGTGCPAAGHKEREHFDMEKPYCIEYKKLIDTLIPYYLKES